MLNSPTTESKQDEGRNSEEIMIDVMQLLAESSLIGLGIFQDNQLKYVNSIFGQICGYPREEVQNWITEEFLNCFHPADRPFINQQLQKKEFDGQKCQNQRFRLRIITKENNIKRIAMLLCAIPFKGKPASLITVTETTDLKEAEGVLRDSIAHHQILEKMDTGVFLEDSYGIISFVNPKTTELLEYDERELLGQHESIVVAPEELEKVRKETAKRVQGVSSSYETIFITKSGKRIEVGISATPLFNDSGVFQGILSVFNDIKKPKLKEEETQKLVNLLQQLKLFLTQQLESTKKALQDSEKKFDSITQSAIDAIVSFDSYGKIISWNKGAQAIFGYNDEEILNSPITKLMPIQIPDESNSKQNNNSASGVNLTKTMEFIDKTIEFLGIRKDGSIFPTEISLATWKAKKKEHYTAIIRDITKRKQMEHALRESEQKYRIIAENSFVGLAIIQQDQLVYVNKAVAQILCTSREEMLKWRARDFLTNVHPSELSFAKEQLANVKNGMKERLFPRFQLRLVLPLNKLRLVDISLNLINYQNDPAIQVTMVDITDYLRKKEILAEENEVSLCTED